MSDNLKPPTGPAICPNCGRTVNALPDRPFHEFEAYVGRCDCGNATMFGATGWVMFPKVPCTKCVAEVEHDDCPCTSAQFQAFKRAERKALEDLRPLARQAHEAWMASLTPKMQSWRNHQVDLQPTQAVARASSGELALELQARGWRVDSRVKRAPGQTGTLKGCPSIPMARILEQRVGACVERPEGAK